MLSKSPKCAFGCDVKRFSEISPEHYWSWMRAYDTGSHTRTNHTIVRGPTIDNPRMIVKRGRQRSGSPLRQSLRVVCEPCNTGWMSRVQEASKPILAPLIEGTFRALSLNEALIVTRMAVLMTMTYEFADPETIVTSQATRTTFKNTLSPPPNWIVVLAPYAGSNLHCAIYHKSGAVTLPSIPAPLNAQTTTFAVGALMLHTLSTPDWALPDPAGYTSDIGGHLVFPHVTTPRRLPAVALDDDGVRSAHMAYWKNRGMDVPIIA
jgi:hypothetical protein